MFQLPYRFKARLGFALAFAMGIATFSVKAQGSTPAPPTAPAEQCQVILKYEGLCGNSRPNPCLSKPGVDYFSNLPNQKIWDDYFYLCVHVPGNTVDRHSHECIQALGIGATCTSTVPELIEYHAVTTVQATATIRQPEPQYQAVTQVSATYCGMLASTGQTIKSYFEACGDVATSQCSNSSAPFSAYESACGTKKPCECVQSYGCRADYCAAPAPATPATPVTPTLPGTPALPTTEEDGATGSSPEESGVVANQPSPNNNGNSFVLGSPSEKSGEAAANGATGCSLHPANISRASIWAIFSKSLNL